MLRTLQNAFKVKDIRDRLLFTFLMLLVVRFGSQLPVPGVDRTFLADWFANQTGDAFNLFSAFTGGSFENMSVFALNITPYITSSIIMQLLTIAIPALEEMQKDGDDGRKQITAITRYITVGLALFEAFAMTVGFGRQGLIPNMNFVTALAVICAMTAGSTFLMWVGEQITEHGVGNGISIVLTINIISRVPGDLHSLYESFMKGKTIAKAAVAGLIILAVIVLVIVLVILLQDAQRRIPVQYTKKMMGRKMVGGQTTYIPLKVNTAGVIPVIFASSLMSLPNMINSVLRLSPEGVAGKVVSALSQNNWFKPSHPEYSIGLLVYILMIIGFAYFYTSITFNPIEVADNMKKQGGFIPGIRPGKPTTDYLNKILTYLVFIGAMGLTLVVIVPIFFNGVFGAYVSFGGTSIIIIVGVVLETIKQIESQLVVRNYRGFLSE